MIEEESKRFQSFIDNKETPISQSDANFVSSRNNKLQKMNYKRH
jgi:hypothetical protein